MNRQPIPTKTCCRASAPRDQSCRAVPELTARLLGPEEQRNQSPRKANWAATEPLGGRPRVCSTAHDLPPVADWRHETRIQRPVSRAVRIEMRPAGDMSWSPSLPVFGLFDHITALHHHEGSLSLGCWIRGHGRGGPRSRRHRPPGRCRTRHGRATTDGRRPRNARPWRSEPTPGRPADRVGFSRAALTIAPNSAASHSSSSQINAQNSASTALGPSAEPVSEPPRDPDSPLQGNPRGLLMYVRWCRFSIPPATRSGQECRGILMAGQRSGRRMATSPPSGQPVRPDHAAAVCGRETIDRALRAALPGHAQRKHRVGRPRGGRPGIYGHLWRGFGPQVACPRPGIRHRLQIYEPSAIDVSRSQCRPRIGPRTIDRVVARDPGIQLTPVPKADGHYRHDCGQAQCRNCQQLDCHQSTPGFQHQTTLLASRIHAGIV